MAKEGDKVGLLFWENGIHKRKTSLRKDGILVFPEGRFAEKEETFPAGRKTALPGIGVTCMGKKPEEQWSRELRLKGRGVRKGTGKCACKAEE